jgi:thiamine biosynthesis lipoprotein
VRLRNPRTKIDLGGIAAGYAVDEAARLFRFHGILDFLIDAGGDMYVGGNNCVGKPWRIGIKDPRDRAQVIDVVEVSDRAVVTSGNYEVSGHTG